MFFLICVFITLIVGVMAGLSDIRVMKIPNVYSAYVMAVFAVAYGGLYFAGLSSAVFGSIGLHVLSALLMFLVTFILFAMRIIGAGDSKFGTACALWVSVKYLPIFLFFMTLVGGVLGLMSIYIKRKKPFKSPVEGGWIAQVQGGADKVPYGVAITVGMLFAFVYAGYFSPDVLSLFLLTQ